MRSRHDDFVGDLRVTSANLGDHVVRIQVLVKELRLQIDGKLHGYARGKQPCDHVVVLGCEHDRRNRATDVTSCHENRSVLAQVRLERHGGAFFLKQRHAALVTLSLRLKCRLG